MEYKSFLLTFVLWLLLFPHERCLTRPVFLFWLQLTVCVFISVSGIPGGCDQVYFNDCNVWKTCSCSVTLLFMELCNNSGGMGPLESVWPRPCSHAASVYGGMGGLLELSGCCGASCLLIFCHFHLRFFYHWLQHFKHLPSYSCSH